MLMNLIFTFSLNNFSKICFVFFISLLFKKNLGIQAILLEWSWLLQKQQETSGSIEIDA